MPGAPTDTRLTPAAPSGSEPSATDAPSAAPSMGPVNAHSAEKVAPTWPTSRVPLPSLPVGRPMTTRPSPDAARLSAGAEPMASV